MNTVNNRNVPTVLNVPPWGGTIMVPHLDQINLVNTCPMDNFLTIFYALMKMHNAFYQHLLRSAELYAGSLLRICAMFDGGDCAMGKCEWLNIFPGRFDLTQPGQLNLWGNEEDLFVSRMYAELETVYTTTCLSPHCPFGVKQVQSKAITLRY